MPIVPDPRLRECDHGTVTRRPLSEVEPRRAAHLTVPFPEGESYEQVVQRVGPWLEDAAAAYGGRAVVVIGHRATFYALEHLVKGVPLHEAVAAPWQWQPGWEYRVVRR